MALVAACRAAVEERRVDDFLNLERKRRRLDETVKAEAEVSVGRNERSRAVVLFC